MPVKVEMPRLSDTMQAGTVVHWSVKEGDKVKSGQALADIETDKATMELTSFDDGVVASITVAEGQNVPVGTLIMLIATAGEDVAAVKAGAGGGGGASGAASAGSASPAKGAPAAAKAAPHHPTSNGTAHAALLAPAVGAPAAVAAGNAGFPAEAAHREPSGRIFVSPLARKIAGDSGLDLSELRGTGPSGRIVRRDVEAAIASVGSRTAAQATGTTGLASGLAAGSANGGAVKSGPRPSAVPTLSAVGTKLAGKVVPLSNMRRIIATRLVESKTTIPHYQVTIDVDMDPLLKLRSELNEQLAAQGLKLSVNDFIVRACALAMHQHPYVNARWVPTPGQESIELLSEVHVGIAIALSEEKGGGLVVATLRNADQIGLRQISTQSRALADKARGKGLAPQEMSDSTFTISNLGMFGVSNFTAIINPPNAAILAVGAAIEKPVVKDGKVVVGNVMSMTMSSDHRIVDGAMAAGYLNTVRNLLEKPATLLV